MSQPTPDSPKPNRLPLLAGIAALAVVAVGFVLWTLFTGDAPEAANLDSATAELADDNDTDDNDTDDSDEADADADGADDDTTSTTAEETETTESDAGSDADAAAAPVDDVNGDWTVDTSIGEFSFEDSTGTFVGFRIGEELTSVGETEAVGRTPNVTGTVTIDGQTVTATSIEADMTAITTDIGQRDGAARRALDTTNFPTATFELTEPIDLGADPASGEPISATAVGDMTIHGVTNPVEVAIDAQLVGDTIAIVGSTDVVFADYDVSAPSAPVVVRLDDFGIIEFQLFLTR